MTPPTFQDLPILALARHVLVREGEEADPVAQALVVAGEEQMEEVTHLLASALTPQQVMTDDLKTLADRILAELREPLVRI